MGRAFFFAPILAILLTMGFRNHTPSGDSSKVTGAASDTLILADNPNRRGASVYSDSSATLYLKLGSGASPTSWTLKMTADDYYETPYGYSGPIYGYWDSATGTAYVTEVS